MGSMRYLISKNKKTIITAVFLIAVAVFIIIAVAKLTHKKDSDSGGDGTVSNIGDTAVIDVTKPPEKEVTSDKTEDVRVVLRVTEYKEEKTVYEVGLDMISGKAFIFENGLRTERQSGLSKYDLVNGIMELYDTDPIKLEELDEPIVSGAYEIDLTVASGVVKQLKTEAETILREVNAADYIEIYLKEKGGTIKRIIVTGENLFISEYKRENLPDLSNYLEEI